MNQVHLYLSAEQRLACMRALRMAECWTRGDASIFALMADEGYLRDKDGKPLSLSKWSTLVEPALTEYMVIAAGATAGIVSDVHDPSTHPLGAMSHGLQEAWTAVKVSKKCVSLAALPATMELHKTGPDTFNAYTAPGVVAHVGVSAKDILALCRIAQPIFKVSIERGNVHRFIDVLDKYSRLLMNQWEYLKELTEDRWDWRRSNWHDRVESTVRSFKQPWTGFDMNASSGIYSTKLHPDAQLVWSVQKAIRHWEMVQRLGYSNRGNATDAPMRDEKWPLVDSVCDAGLDALPVGGGIVRGRDTFVAVESYKAPDPLARVALASSYSPVSLLNALAYSQAHPGQQPIY